MRVAFAIVSLFRGGGLQRDCLGIARLLRARGHTVTVFTARISSTDETTIGEIAADLDVEVVKCDAWTNHGRNLRFAAAVAELTRGRFDRLVGFDKLICLDVLYCADPSIRFRLRSNPFLGLLPRYRALARLEKNSFAAKATTRLLLLNERQASEYRQVWSTDAERLFLVPPTISLARRQPAFRHDGTRERVRDALAIENSIWSWLSICMQPHNKGLDRVVDALAAFPKARLLVVGANAADKRAAACLRRAQNLDVNERITWLGYRSDLGELMAASDVLVHPARLETTGSVILEAVINGLPVVTTTACGYSRHVETAQAGIVVAEPFRQDDFLSALTKAQDNLVLRQWSAAGAAYGAQDYLYSGWSRAADLIIGDLPPATNMR